MNNILGKITLGDIATFQKAVKKAFSSNLNTWLPIVMDFAIRFDIYIEVAIILSKCGEHIEDFLKNDKKVTHLDEINLDLLRLCLSIDSAAKYINAYFKKLKDLNKRR